MASVFWPYAEEKGKQLQPGNNGNINNGNNGNINNNLKMQPPPVEELTSKNISFHKSETAAPCLNATPTSWRLYYNKGETVVGLTNI